MKLNLGCGPDVKQGYINVDFRQTHPAVMKVDLSQFPWPFDNDSADEILMLDFLEHFPYATTMTILAECRRILKPQGTVKIQVPDFDHVSNAIKSVRPFMCNGCGYKFRKLTGAGHDHALGETFGCPSCKQTYEQISDAGIARLFGGQDYEGNFHQTAFDKRRLRRMCAAAKLSILVDWLEDEHQYANWNIFGAFTK